MVRAAAAILSLDIDACLLSDARLPQCLVAMSGQGQPVGTVSLRTSSPGSENHPGAWLTALLVPHDLRRAGIGAALICAAEDEALRLGYDELFATTGSAASLFLCRGWRQIDTAWTPKGVLGVYRQTLKRRL